MMNETDSSVIRPVAEVTDAQPFLREASTVLSFGVVQFSTVIDIGCGTGNSSFALASMFPNINHVIAVDVDEGRLSTAKLRCSSKRSYCDTIQFVKGNIETGEGLFQFRGIRHIVSIHCFSCLKRQKEAFQMVHTLLCPGGGAAVLFAIQMDYYNLLSDLFDHPKWGQFMESEDVIPESHTKRYDENHYRQLLAEIGFDIHTCRKEEKFSSYRDADDLLNWVFSSLPFKEPLSPSLLSEFRQDLSVLLKERHAETDKDCRLYYKIMKIIVFKKKDSIDERFESYSKSTIVDDYSSLITNDIERNQ